MCNWVVLTQLQHRQALSFFYSTFQKNVATVLKKWHDRCNVIYIKDTDFDKLIVKVP